MMQDIKRNLRAKRYALPAMPANDETDAG